jgi:hypothetical protein
MTNYITPEMRLAAERYALSDKSDPFALARAKTHLRNGIASFSHPDGGKGYYDAEETTERREIIMPNGETLAWNATVYRNVMKP